MSPISRGQHFRLCCISDFLSQFPRSISELLHKPKDWVGCILRCKFSRMVTSLLRVRAFRTSPKILAPSPGLSHKSKDRMSCIFRCRFSRMVISLDRFRASSRDMISYLRKCAFSMNVISSNRFRSFRTSSRDWDSYVLTTCPPSGLFPKTLAAEKFGNKPGEGAVAAHFRASCAQSPRRIASPELLPSSKDWVSYVPRCKFSRKAYSTPPSDRFSGASSKLQRFL